MTFLLALLLAIPPCISSAPNSSPAANALERGVTVYTIPPPKLVPRGNNPQWVKVRGGEWPPTPSQLLDIRTGFKAYVEAQASMSDVSMPPWQDYTFQYQGRVAKGKHVLYIYAFCEIDADYPRQKLSEQFFLVLDGGPCYFRAWWSPGSRSFTNISFNGH